MLPDDHAELRALAAASAMRALIQAGTTRVTSPNLAGGATAELRFPDPNTIAPMAVAYADALVVALRRRPEA